MIIPLSVVSLFGLVCLALLASSYPNLSSVLRVKAEQSPLPEPHA